MNKLQVDEKWTVYIVSNYVPTKYLLIKGKKKKVYSGETWQTPS